MQPQQPQRHGPEALVGAVLDGRYRIERLLGEGGMAAVYKATQITLEKDIAIKVLNPRFARYEVQVQRFLREARSSSKIRHPNVVDITDFGKLPDGTVYFAMELLEGQDLADYVRARGALPWPHARELLLQIVRALKAAHAKGIVHRDIKPANCFVVASPDGDSTRPPFVKVVDFGIAKVTEASPDAPALTGTQEVLGTANYMSPEQAMGGHIDVRTDVYALGVLAYELVTGQVPFVGDSIFSVLNRHVNEAPAPPRTKLPSIPPHAEAIILKALEKQPELRFQSMVEMEDALLADGVGFYPERTAFIPGMGDGRSTGPGTELLPSLGYAAGGTHPPAMATHPPAMLSNSGPLGGVSTHPGAPTHPGMHGTAPQTRPHSLAGAPAFETSPGFGHDRFGATGAGGETRVTIVESRSSTVWIAMALALFAFGGAGATYMLVSDRGDRGDKDEPAAAAVVTAPAPTPKPPAAERPSPTEPVIEAKPEPEDTKPEPAPEPAPEEAEESEPTPRPGRTRPPKAKPPKTKAPATDDSVASAIAARAKASCAAAPGTVLQASFTIKSSGETSLIDAPNSDAGRCLERLVRGATFPAGSLRAGSVSVRF